MLAPFGHGRDEFAGVPIRVPFAAVGINPAGACLGVQIVEDRLHHPRVEEQPFDSLAVEGAAFVGERAVDEELLAANGDFRASRLDGRGGGRQAEHEAGQHRDPPTIHVHDCRLLNNGVVSPRRR